MRTKIKVLVNDVLNCVGSATARNVMRMPDMELLPVSITACGDYRKTSINQLPMALIRPADFVRSLIDNTPLELSPLFTYGQPDIVVDVTPDSIFRKEIPSYLNSGTSYVLNTVNSENLWKLIKGLDVNIALVPENASEMEILAAIRYLDQKNKDRVFGQVFSNVDLAA